MASSQPQASVTVREGTSERYWYILSAYVSLTLIIAVLSPFVIEDLGLSAELGAGLGLVLFVLIGFALFTCICLFKDNAYVRGHHDTWRPRWWYYIGFALGVPFSLAAILTLFGSPAGGFGLGLLAIIPAVWGANVAWLYNRHRYVGIP